MGAGGKQSNCFLVTLIVIFTWVCEGLGAARLHVRAMGREPNPSSKKLHKYRSVVKGVDTPVCKIDTSIMEHHKTIRDNDVLVVRLLAIPLFFSFILNFFL